MSNGSTYTLSITPSVASNALRLSDAELDLITADTLRIGRADNSGDITLRAAISPANIDTLALITNGAVIDGTPTEQIDITVSNLSILAFDGVGTSDEIDTAVGVVASSGVNGGFNLRNTGDLIVGTVDGVAGISATSGGSLVIAAAGSLTINEGVLGSNVALSTIDSATAGQNLIVNAGGNIFSLSNSLILSAGDNLTIAAQLGMSESAAIELIADSGAADIVGSTIDLTGATFTTANAVTITGSTAADTFNIAPFAGNALSIVGASPTALPGDILNIVLPPSNGILEPTAVGAGTFSFTDREDVAFTT